MNWLDNEKNRKVSEYVLKYTICSQKQNQTFIEKRK